ncbi:hypothetical protein KKH96_03395 [Patescibacteria group bacterium]|nr:hypothetical protein [Patescibacteria group bacterium]
MLFLGIDTTFHTTGLALIDNNNKVKFNKSISIDLYDQDADRFFSAHIKNLVDLLNLLPDNTWNKIKLISVINKKGTFQSLPIGVTAACILGYSKKKKIIGIDHEIAHLYSNWLERQEKEFKFPILGLSVSGAHTAIYYQESHKKINKLISIVWDSKKNSFNGIAALFDVFCHGMRIKIIKTGDGGNMLSDLAKRGKKIEIPELNEIRIKRNKNTLIILDTNKAIEKIYSKYRKNLLNENFQRNLSFSFLDYIFNLLGQEFLKIAKDYKVKEMHLVGGVSANSIFKDKIKNIAVKNKIVFKAPLKKEFCGDNAAMVAVRGKYKSIFTKQQKFISVLPSFWYYKHYCNNILSEK